MSELKTVRKNWDNGSKDLHNEQESRSVIKNINVCHILLEAVTKGTVLHTRTSHLSLYSVHPVATFLISRPVKLHRANHQLCISTAYASLRLNYREPPRRWRQQQILTGDTHSIKAPPQHHDVLWRASWQIWSAPTHTHTPPPGTTGCFSAPEHGSYLVIFWWRRSYSVLTNYNFHDIIAHFSPLKYSTTCQPFTLLPTVALALRWISSLPGSHLFQLIWKSTCRDSKLTCDG